jgi:hypothetical protein
MWFTSPHRGYHAAAGVALTTVTFSNLGRVPDLFRQVPRQIDNHQCEPGLGAQSSRAV